MPRNRLRDALLPLPRRWLGWLLAVAGGLALLPCPAVLAKDYHPSHPDVLAMVERGVAYLEANVDKKPGGDFAESELFAGYAVYKATGDTESRLVKAAISRAVAIARSLQGAQERHSHKIVYEAALCCLLLADLDAAQYAPELRILRDFYVKVQKGHGGYGYLDYSTGDTSQTQYAMLGLWTLHKSGFEVPVDTTEAALRYLMATQDPSGGWGYQGNFGNGQLVRQDLLSKSLATAGLGAMLIGMDVLNLFEGSLLQQEEEDDVPKAFVRIDLKQKQQERKKAGGLQKDDFAGAVNMGVRYQNTNPSASGARWYFYWLYSQERYESFLELMVGKREKSPAWYNAGVEDLKRLQDDKGAWGTITNDLCPPDVCTSFAILYLIRSTQKTIAKLNEGVLAGGYGLPSNVSAVRRVGDKIVGTETASVDSLLTMLEKNDSDSVEVGLLPENLALSRNKDVRKAQVSRLARLLESQDAKSRRVAAKLLGRSEDLNQVPDLIFALTDPDPYVPAIAEEGLRLLSRRLGERNVEVDAPQEQKDAAAKRWREWYLSMRPDYIFIDR
jgi:hypothetical protein